MQQLSIFGGEPVVVEQVWAAPLEAAPAAAGSAGAGVPAAGWRQHMRTAWDVNPRLALALLDRCARPAATNSLLWGRSL